VTHIKRINRNLFAQGNWLRVEHIDPAHASISNTVGSLWVTAVV